MAWAASGRELCTTHGYSTHEVGVWAWRRGGGKLSRVARLKGHTARVLFLAAAPDGQTVVTGAADETLRFWRPFSPSVGIESTAGFSGTSLPSSSPAHGRGVVLAPGAAAHRSAGAVAAASGKQGHGARLAAEVHSGGARVAASMGGLLGSGTPGLMSTMR